MLVVTSYQVSWFHVLRGGCQGFIAFGEGVARKMFSSSPPNLSPPR